MNSPFRARPTRQSTRPAPPGPRSAPPGPRPAPPGPRSRASCPSPAPDRAERRLASLQSGRERFSSARTGSSVQHGRGSTAAARHAVRWRARPGFGASPTGASGYRGGKWELVQRTTWVRPAVCRSWTLLGSKTRSPGAARSAGFSVPKKTA